MRDAVIGYGVLFVLLAFFLGLIPLVIYNRFRPESKLQKRINVFFASQRFKDFTNLVVVCIFVVIGAVYLNLYFTDSGWFPRTREVEVYVNPVSWAIGELKFCASGGTPGNHELEYLMCDAKERDSHLLKVKFWGTITMEREKYWKCEREESSLTCKLQ